MSLAPSGESQTWYAAPAKGGAAAMHRVGGRNIPRHVNRLCKTCTSEHRTMIDNALLKSYGYTAIVNSLPEDAGLSARNIMDHFKAGHLGLEHSVRRVMIEKDAEERGLDIEGYESTLANHITFAKVGIQRVMERMATGELDPDINHGIAFANLLLRVEEVAGDGVDTDALTQGFIVYMNAMRQVCSPEQVQAISDAISTNPIMRALLAKEQQQSNVIEAEQVIEA